MGYTFCCCDVGIFSPLFRLKDFVSALMGWIDLVSDALTSKKYWDDCNDKNSDVLCIYFCLSIIFMCLPSIAVTVIMLSKGTHANWEFLYGFFYPIWGPWRRMYMMLSNFLICFVDGENDEATRAVVDEIAFPEIILEAVPQV